MQTIIANMRHAARNRETVNIGGGSFGPSELKQAADILERATSGGGHVAHCVAFLRADGSHAGRFEYFKTAERAAQYAERSNANGANVRAFRMIEG